MRNDVLSRRPCLSDESGFTLPELLLTMVIGLIVLGSATMITIGASRHNTEVSNRQVATQEGRLAMERMIQLLRSQVCSTAGSFPMVAGSTTSVSFYSDLSDGSLPVYKHTLTYDPAAQTLSDSAVKGSTSDPQTFTAAAKTTVLAEHVIPNGANPIFRYYGYPASVPAGTTLQPSVELVPGAAGLTAANLGKVARVDVNFVVEGATKLARGNSTNAEMTDQVFVRLADPNSGTTFDPSCT